MTVSRRLHEVGLFGRIGAKKPFITQTNRIARLELARAHVKVFRGLEESLFPRRIQVQPLRKRWTGVRETPYFKETRLQVLGTRYSRTSLSIGCSRLSLPSE